MMKMLILTLCFLFHLLAYGIGSPTVDLTPYFKHSGEVEASGIWELQDFLMRNMNTESISFHSDNENSHHVRYEDSEAISALVPHTSNENSHHTRYTDSEAVSALSPHTGNENAHFEKFTDVEAVSALAPHTGNENAHHTRYEDSEAVSALVPHTGNANVHGGSVSFGNYEFDADILRKEGAADMVLQSNGNNQSMILQARIAGVLTDFVKLNTTDYPLPVLEVQQSVPLALDFSNANWTGLMMEDGSGRLEVSLVNFINDEYVKAIFDPLSGRFTLIRKDSGGDIGEMFFDNDPASKSMSIFHRVNEGSGVPTNIDIKAVSANNETTVARAMGNSNVYNIFTPDNFVIMEGKGYLSSNTNVSANDRTLIPRKYSDDQDALLLPLVGGTMSGDINMTGNGILDSGDVLPISDNVNSLGSASKRWKELHVGSSSIYIGGVKLGVRSGRLASKEFHAHGNENTGEAGCFKMYQGSSPTYYETGHVVLHANDNKLYFQEPDGTNLKIVKEDASGNVGIGTDVPGLPLEVRSADDNQAMFMDSTPQAQGVGGGIMFGGKYTDAGAEAMAGRIGTPKTNGTSGHVGFDMVFETQDSVGSITERGRFTSDAKFGIGTDSPIETLDVNGDAMIRVDLTVDNDAILDGNVFVSNMKTGTNQNSAGAAAGELWGDSDDGFTIKLGQ